MLNYNALSLDVEDPMDQLRRLCRLTMAAKLLGPEILEDAQALVIICPEMFLHLSELVKGTLHIFTDEEPTQIGQLVACIANAELLAEAMPTIEEKQQLLLQTISEYGYLFK